jgi:hypothetical protein
MKLKRKVGQGLWGPENGAQAPNTQNVTLHDRRAAGNGSKMRTGFNWLSRRQGQAGGDGQRLNGQQTIGKVRQWGRKQKAIQAFDMQKPRRDRISLGIDPNQTGCVIGAQFHQHGAFGGTGTARSGQDQGERKNKAGKAVRDPLHGVLITESGRLLLDLDQS